jgi:catechol 2,3-dioxygenase-like lactoylglutathione lyase family enzyme
VPGLRICIDVPDLDRAIAFYVAALGLVPGRRLGAEWAELLGAPVPVDLLPRAAGSAPSPRGGGARTWERHWTPVHLDLVVDDLDRALARALEAGASLERPVSEAAWGRMANLADPFGHGLCLLEFRGRGYDELLAGR